MVRSLGLWPPKVDSCHPRVWRGPRCQSNFSLELPRQDVSAGIQRHHTDAGRLHHASAWKEWHWECYPVRGPDVAARDLRPAQKLWRSAAGGVWPVLWWPKLASSRAWDSPGEWSVCSDQWLIHRVGVAKSQCSKYLSLARAIAPVTLARAIARPA